MEPGTYRLTLDPPRSTFNAYGKNWALGVAGRHARGALFGQREPDDGPGDSGDRGLLIDSFFNLSCLGVDQRSDNDRTGEWDSRQDERTGLVSR